MILSVKVTPRASKNEIIEVDSATYKVKITMAPEKGRANEQLIKLLSSYLKIPKSNITISRGTSSRHKLVEIKDNQ